MSKPKRRTLHELAALAEHLLAKHAEGGKARARKLSKAQLTAIAKQGAARRWAGHVKKAKKGQS